MRRKWFLLLLVIVAVGAVLVYKKRHAGPPVSLVPDPVPGQFALTSTAFRNGGPIPPFYTCDDKNRSPALQWRDAPRGTESFALVMEDPDAGIGGFTHWLMCDMPGTEQEMSPGVAAMDIISVPFSAVQGKNDFADVGYGGPCPPPGKVHRYVIRLYALDATLDLMGGFAKYQLNAAMKGHVLGEAGIMGVYKRAEEGS